MRKLNEIILHCSATPEGRDVSVGTIRKWHKARGWNDIGYHYVIDLNGNVHEGRPITKVGAHVKGRNTGTVGVCYVGGVAKDGRTPKDTRTSSQKLAIVNLIKELKAKYPSIKEVSGHNQYAAKACPSFDASTFYDQLVGATPTTKQAPAPAKPDKRYRYLQKLLAGTGRSFGLIDGIEGERTIAAIKDYQQYMGLPVTGKFDEATVAALREIEKDVRAVVPDEVETEVKKQTGFLGWLMTIIGSAGAAMSWLADQDWMSIVAIGGVGIAGIVVLTLLGPRLAKTIRSIKETVEA